MVGSLLLCPQSSCAGVVEIGSPTMHRILSPCPTALFALTCHCFGEIFGATRLDPVSSPLRSSPLCCSCSCVLALLSWLSPDVSNTVGLLGLLDEWLSFDPSSCSNLRTVACPWARISLIRCCIDCNLGVGSEIT